MFARRFWGILFFLLFFCSPVSATSWNGYFLRQIEGAGEIWYVDPVVGQRILLNTPEEAFDVLFHKGLDISMDLYEVYESTGIAPEELAGSIFFGREDSGELHYVFPADLRIHHFETPDELWILIDSLAQDVTNEELEGIPQEGMEMVTDPEISTDIVFEDALPWYENVGYQAPYLVGYNTLLLEFYQTDYEMARDSGKKIVLYFYSMSSSEGILELEQAFEGFLIMTDPETIGFRVNIDDVYTNMYEQQLAESLGVSQAGTKVIVKDGRLGLWSIASWGVQDWKGNAEMTF